MQSFQVRFLLRLVLFLPLVAVSSVSGTSFVSVSHRPIHSYAALGDSYAAGAGAGSPLLPTRGGFACARYSDAYPVQVANSTDLDVGEFKDLACGGATSVVVLRDQVPYVGDSDLVSLTVGGNEVDFFLVLNECIYHWWPSSTCEAELAKARGLIESSELEKNFQALMSETVKQLKPDALWLVTGYAKFFNDQTDICDHVTFSRTRPLDYLTKTKRRALNQLVGLLNDVIRATAEVHGAVYADIDAVFEGHRFCEDGVREPDVQRSSTWFFNLPASAVEGDGSRPGFRRQQVLDGQAQELPSVEFFRTFHPTSLGHQAISEEIVREALARRTSS